LKAFCFNRWCHIQLRNKFPAPIMSIMSLFPDQIVSTHHMDFVVVMVALTVFCAKRLDPARRRLARRFAPALSDFSTR
jgi:hypothetical protein